MGVECSRQRDQHRGAAGKGAGRDQGAGSQATWQGQGVCSKCDGKSLGGSSAAMSKISFIKLDTVSCSCRWRIKCVGLGRGKGGRLGPLSRPEVTGPGQE